MPTVHQRRKSYSCRPSPLPHHSEPAGEPVLRQGLALTSSDVACLPCLSVAAESHAHLLRLGQLQILHRRKAAPPWDEKLPPNFFHSLHHGHAIVHVLLHFHLAGDPKIHHEVCRNILGPECKCRLAVRRSLLETRLVRIHHASLFPIRPAYRLGCTVGQPVRVFSAAEQTATCAGSTVPANHVIYSSRAP